MSSLLLQRNSSINKTYLCTSVKILYSRQIMWLLWYQALQQSNLKGVTHPRLICKHYGKFVLGGITVYYLIHDEVMLKY